VVLEPSTGFIRKVTVFDILKQVFFSFLFLAEDVKTLPARQMWSPEKNHSRLNTPAEAPRR